MAVRDRINSFNVLNALKAQPLATLRQYRLAAALPPGHRTEGTEIAFAVVHTTIHLGPAASHMPGKISINGLAAPTRAWNSPNRFAPLLRFNALAYDFWVTERQTGCSLIILDWGGGQMSMGHLLPHPYTNYGRAGQFVVRNTPVTVYAEMQRQSLKPEVTQLVDASKAGGIDPLRYILVQSNHAAINLRSLNVLGILHNGQMNFYMQTAAGTGDTVVALRWTAWNPWLPYFTY